MGKCETDSVVTPPHHHGWVPVLVGLSSLLLVVCPAHLLMRCSLSASTSVRAMPERRRDGNLGVLTVRVANVATSAGARGRPGLWPTAGRRRQDVTADDRRLENPVPLCHHRQSAGLTVEGRTPVMVSDVQVYALIRERFNAGTGGKRGVNSSFQ